MCMFLGHIICNGCVIGWTYIHRNHHKYFDREQDPHSPKHVGYFYSMFLIPMAGIRVNFRQVRDLLRQKDYRYQMKYYWSIVFAWIVLLGLVEPMLIVYGWLVPSFLAKVGIGLITTVSHRAGKPHDDMWVGLLTGGEGFHAVHHKNSRTIRQHKYDVGGWILERMKKSEGVG